MDKKIKEVYIKIIANYLNMDDSKHKKDILRIIKRISKWKNKHLKTIKNIKKKQN